MADISVMVSEFAAGIRQDAAVMSWALDIYGREHQVFENCDSRNLPAAGDCPLVVVWPVSKAAGLSPAKKAHVIGISCVVHDDGHPLSDDGVFYFAGGRQVEVFRRMVLAAVTGRVPSGVTLEAVEIDYDTIEQFPYVSATMFLTFHERKLIGQDPYE